MDDHRTPSIDGGTTTTDLPLRVRVAAARSLLESSSADDYTALPAAQQAHFQEAIEYLQRVQERLPHEQAD